MAAASDAATAVCRGNIGLTTALNWDLLSCLSSIRFVKGKEAVTGRFAKHINSKSELKLPKELKKKTKPREKCCSIFLHKEGNMKYTCKRGIGF